MSKLQREILVPGLRCNIFVVLVSFSMELRGGYGILIAHNNHSSLQTAQNNIIDQTKLPPVGIGNNIVEAERDNVDCS